MLVVGSRLRGNETLKYELKLPRLLLRIDADPASKAAATRATASSAAMPRWRWMAWPTGWKAD